MTPSTYTAYFGLQDKPFTVTTDPHFFYLTSTSQKVYASLLHGIRERKGVIVLTGAAGTGKTTLLRRVMRDGGETVRCVFFSNPDWTFDELLSFTCEDLGLQVEGETRLQKLQALTAFLLARGKEGETPVLLIDEAQDLGDEVLENLGLLSAPETTGATLLPIVLAGQPELERKLAQPHLRHLTQHVTLRCRLARLKDQEIGPLISHRLQRAGYERQDLFPPEALQCIARYSRGIPRLITTICHEALFIAYRTAQKTVSVEIIEQVVRNLQLDQTRIQRLWRRAFAGKRPQKRRATKVRAAGEPLFRQEKDPAAQARAEQTPSPAAVPQPTVGSETPAKLARVPSTPRRPALLLLSSSWIYLLSSAVLVVAGGYWLSTFSRSVSAQKPTPGLEALAQLPSPPQEKKGPEAGLPLLGGNEIELSLREPSAETATGPAAPRTGETEGEGGPAVSPPSVVAKAAPVLALPLPQFPRITQATPASEDVLTVAEGQRLRFALEAESGDGSLLRYTWLLDGREQTAGKQWTYRPNFTEGGEKPKEVKAVVTNSDNLTVTRTWQVRVQDVNRPPRITLASPRPEAVAVDSGGVQEFSVMAADPDSDDRLVYVWFLNGQEVARGERWQFHAPSAETLRHETSYTVAVEVLDNEARKDQAARVTWNVTVKAPVLPPIIRDAQPGEETVSTQAGQPLDFSVVAELPGSSDEAKKGLRYHWSVESAPPQLTQTGNFRFVATTPALYHLTAVAVSAEGRESAPRRWVVEVRPAEGVLPPFFSLSEAEVRAWLEAQRQAWQEKNVDALMELGVVSGQNVKRVRTILASYTSFSVALQEVDIHLEGSRAEVTCSRVDTIDGRIVPHPDRKVFTLEKEANGRLTARPH